MSYKSKGDGSFRLENLGRCGADVTLEDGVRIFHPSHVFLGDGVYIGHDVILEGYHQEEMHIGAGTWVGNRCFFHAAGGIHIGENVGIGPYVKILTSTHAEAGRDTPILHSPLQFAPVTIEDDADIGVGAILLPGCRVGRGAQIGAGAVVTSDLPPYSVCAGVPARVIRQRP